MSLFGLMFRLNKNVCRYLAQYLAQIRHSERNHYYCSLWKNVYKIWAPRLEFFCCISFCLALGYGVTCFSSRNVLWGSLWTPVHWLSQGLPWTFLPEEGCGDSSQKWTEALRPVLRTTQRPKGWLSQVTSCLEMSCLYCGPQRKLFVQRSKIYNSLKNRKYIMTKI